MFRNKRAQSEMFWKINSIRGNSGTLFTPSNSVVGSRFYASTARNHSLVSRNKSNSKRTKAEIQNTEAKSNLNLWFYIPTSLGMIYSLSYVFNEENDPKLTKEEIKKERIIEFIIKETKGYSALVDYQTPDCGIAGVTIIRQHQMRAEALTEYDKKSTWWNWRAKEYLAKLENQDSTEKVDSTNTYKP